MARVANVKHSTMLLINVKPCSKGIPGDMTPF